MADKIVFTRGVPPPEAFPTEDLGACFDAAVRGNPAIVLQYGQQRGYAPLREELAAEYEVSPEEVLVGNGSLQLQDLVSSFLIHPAGRGRHQRRASGGGTAARGSCVPLPGSRLPESGGGEALAGEAAEGRGARRRVRVLGHRRHPLPQVALRGRRPSALAGDRPL